MTEEEAEALGALIGIGLLCIGGLIVFLLPTLIAFGRGHHYKWIIFVVNVFGSSLLGVGWIAAFIWAVWPQPNPPVTSSATPSAPAANVPPPLANGGSVPAKRFCPHCGAPVSGGAFCAKCGGRL